MSSNILGKGRFTGPENNEQGYILDSLKKGKYGNNILHLEHEQIKRKIFLDNEREDSESNDNFEVKIVQEVDSIIQKGINIFKQNNPNFEGDLLESTIEIWDKMYTIASVQDNIVDEISFEYDIYIDDDFVIEKIKENLVGFELDVLEILEDKFGKDEHKNIE